MDRQIAAAFVFALLASQGCATFHGSETQRIYVATEPPGATAKLNTGEVFATPGFFRVDRDETSFLTLSLEGYQEERVELIRRFNPWVLGNVFFHVGGLIGATIDYVNGAIWNLEPDRIERTLKPVPRAEPEKPDDKPPDKPKPDKKPKETKQ